MSFIAALDAELEALHNTLATDPTFVKWRELQRIRGLYSQVSADVVLSGPSGMTAVQVKHTPVQQSPSRGEVDAGPRGRRPDPSRSRAVQEAETIIRAANGDPVPTSDIFEELQGQGITIPGERPLNNLSAMLSNSGLFAANGRRGWTLKQDVSNVDGSDGDIVGSEQEGVMDFNDEITEASQNAITTVAHYIVQTLDEESKSQIRKLAASGGAMPSEIETNIEETACRTLRRPVLNSEIVAIRSEFIKSLFHRERELVKSE